MADFIKMKSYVGQARRGADVKLRYWSDVSLRDGVLVILADSGHANGTPESDERMRYRSVGGYFVLIANAGILEDKEVRANVLYFHSGQTKRVCRSTLAAEASHLAEGVETGDWLAVLLEEALVGDIDLQRWPEIVDARKRVYVTDAKSVFDYLAKDNANTSSDKRMAIEGALLRETIRRPNAFTPWIDGLQNFADVLTKAGADKAVLYEFMRSGMIGLVQTEQNKQVKAHDLTKQRRDAARRAQVASEVEQGSFSSGD